MYAIRSYYAFHMGQNPDGKKYNGLDLILRNAEKIEMFINMATDIPAQRTSPHTQPVDKLAQMRQHYLDHPELHVGRNNFV